MYFEKVSKKAWMRQCAKLGISKNRADIAYDNIKIPARSTNGSCGYDFVCPLDIIITTEQTTLIPTGIRAKLDNGTFLMLCPRSSCVKHGYTMSNNLGIIDEDYYNADNEGNIMVPVISTGKVSYSVDFNIGDKIAQGIIMPYLTSGDIVNTVRTGGFGSTGESIKNKENEEDHTKVLEFTDKIGVRDEVEIKEERLTESEMDSLFKDIPEQEDIEDDTPIENDFKEEEPVAVEKEVEEEVNEEEKEDETPSIPKYIAFNNKLVVNNVFTNRVVIHEINYMINAIKNISASTYFNLLKKKNGISSLDEVSGLFVECANILGSSESAENISAIYIKDIVISLVYGEAYKVHPEQIEKIVALLLDIRANGDLDKIAEAGDLTNGITKDSDNLDGIIDKLTELKG